MKKKEDFNKLQQYVSTTLNIDIINDSNLKQDGLDFFTELSILKENLGVVIEKVNNIYKFIEIVNIKKNKSYNYKYVDYKALINSGHILLNRDNLNYNVIGCDEAGRGCWAGPIFGASVIIPEGKDIPNKIQDSKKLTEKERDEMFEYIINNYIYYIKSISANDIDTKGLQWANKEVMSSSAKEVYNKTMLKDGIIALVDGTLKFEEFPLDYNSLIDGDYLIPRISAASILAKVSRDRYLNELSKKDAYKNYGFDKHKGYGTPLHIESLKLNGVSDEHRKSYKPIKEFI